MQPQPNKTRQLRRITTNFSMDQNEILGQGQFGTVYWGKKYDEGREVAIKEISEEMVERYGKLFQREIEILQKLKLQSHQNLVRYYGFQKKNGFVYLFFELCHGGNLMDKITQASLKEDTIKAYFRDIMAGLVEIHSHGIIHRDLKPQNILVDKEGVLKLSDFGLSRQAVMEGSINFTMKVGSYAYHAPQVFADKLYDERSDVWSAGLILYLMLTGTLCREYTINSEADIDKRNSELRLCKLNLCFKGFQPIWEKLLRKMLIFDWRTRATSKEILEEFDQWINRPLFQQFTVQLAIDAKPEEGSPPDYGKLEEEVMTSLKDEQSCQSLFEYLEYMNYYYECRKISELGQKQLLLLAKNNPQIRDKYQNFFFLCINFLADSAIYVRIRNILDEMSVSNFPTLLQECQKLTPFEKERYLLLRNFKMAKYSKISSDFEKPFAQVTSKLLSYRQRKDMTIYEQVFQKIAELATDFNQITFHKIAAIFDNLCTRVELKPSHQKIKTLSDAEVKFLFILKKLRELSERFTHGFHPMKEEQKGRLISQLQILEPELLRKDLSE